MNQLSNKENVGILSNPNIPHPQIGAKNPIGSFQKHIDSVPQIEPLYTNEPMKD